MKILGYSYTVKRDVAANNSDVQAMVDCTKLEIVYPVDKRNTQMEISAMIHEILEAGKYHLQLEISHSAIMGYEVLIHQVFTEAGVDLSPLLRELPDAIDKE